MKTEPVSLAAIYDDHASSLFRFVLSLTRSEADTEDILQKLFCRLAEKPDQLTGVSNVRSYLVRAAHRLVIDSGRKRDRAEIREAAAYPPSPFASLEDPDAGLFQKSVHDALQILPPDQRAVVCLKVWEGFTLQEIAASLDISPNTAASRFRCGIAKLRDALQLIYNEIQ